MIAEAATVRCPHRRAGDGDNPLPAPPHPRVKKYDSSEGRIPQPQRGSAAHMELSHAPPAAQAAGGPEKTRTGYTPLEQPQIIIKNNNKLLCDSSTFRGKGGRGGRKKLIDSSRRGRREADVPVCGCLSFFHAASHPQIRQDRQSWQAAEGQGGCNGAAVSTLRRPDNLSIFSTTTGMAFAFCSACSACFAPRVAGMIAGSFLQCDSWHT